MRAVIRAQIVSHADGRNEAFGPGPKDGPRDGPPPKGPKGPKGPKDGPNPYDTPILMGGMRWGTMTEEEHQRFPGDYEAQAGQGRISLHSEEHLATSDRGIVMQRRLLARQMQVVAEGGDPLGVKFDPDGALVNVRSGNFFRAAQAAE